MPWTYILRSLINPISFVIVWYAILRLYGASYSFGSPNFNFNYFVIILTLKPPSSNTSSIVFFPIYTWIIPIWLFIATIIVLTSGTKIPTCLSMVALLKLWIFSGFSYAKDFFKLKNYFKQLFQVQSITCFQHLLTNILKNLFYCDQFLLWIYYFL
jgi:hypothetical protein